MNIYGNIFRAFEKAKIQYLIVGGVAINLHGYIRYTGDIDILLALDKNNLSKMEAVMKKMGYIERLPVQLHELQDKKKVKKWLQEKGMTAYTFLPGSERSLVDIDILVAHSFDFKKFSKKKKLMEAWGLKLPVISIDDLIAMKKDANRDKDLLDIKALLELKGLL